MFNTSEASAQASDVDMTLNWITEAQALTALDGAINQKVLDQSNYTQGSTPWLNLDNYIRYYKLIYITIEDGSTVPASVGKALDSMTAIGVADQMLPNATLQQLHASAVDLLTL
jgi:hypothetical protein